MEQSIRTQAPGPRRRPPGGGVDGAAVPGPARSPDSRLRTASGGRSRPRPRLRFRLALPARSPSGGGRPARLTAVGTGVAGVVGTLVVAVLDRLLFGGLGVLFGLGYLVVCFQLAVRVRFADLPAAPISGPLAFAAALVLVQPPESGGLVGRVVALASGLALRAGWLFAGTGLAALIVAARWVAQRPGRRSR
ncbi:DUF6542 domain-containing protein [Kitasatospora camelliae]|uniref:DUF6542 domain-containing protein n=1 Tax=Kitasatospora camelliae TaxID=3156397 RepID=A0AAU8JXV9_9ACTN